MGKGVAKYGFKSGILPQPRRILPKLRTPAEIQAEIAQNRGFEDPAMAPKGSLANPPLKHQVTAQEKIAHSAKQPSTVKPSKTELQRWKLESAQIRRQYFVDALEAQGSMDKKELRQRQQQLEQSEARHKHVAETADSEASQLTMPTIDAMLLEGPFVIPRTREQQEELELKRAHNRKQHELLVAESRSQQLLELYQTTSDYIVTEADLDAAINREFVSSKGVQRPDPRIAAVTGPENHHDFSAFASLRQESATPDSVTTLKQQLLGTTSNLQPGLGEVEDVLGGRNEA